ncbi:MAG: DUF3147 family protein [Pseudomonadota bacterium]
MYFLLKIVITALVVATVSELARRYSVFAALIASLPLTSILAMVWLYEDTHDVQKISALSSSIFWMVLPSLLFFLVLPLLLHHGVRFYPALLIACAIMAVGYAIFVAVKNLAA